MMVKLQAGPAGNSGSDALDAVRRIESRVDTIDRMPARTGFSKNAEVTSRHVQDKQGSHGHITECIRAKIAELEANIADLRIAQLHSGARKASLAEDKTWTGQSQNEVKASNQARRARPSGRSAIADILGRRGALSAAEIAEHIRATGRDISNRTVSFSLQSLKKRGLAKSADGKWTLRKARSRRARS